MKPCISIRGGTGLSCVWVITGVGVDGLLCVFTCSPVEP